MAKNRLNPRPKKPYAPNGRRPKRHGQSRPDKGHRNDAPTADGQVPDLRFPQDDGPVEPAGTTSGVLEITPRGHGFLRLAARDYLAQATDTFVAPQLIEQHKLRSGLTVTGTYAAATKGNPPRLLEVQEIEGLAPDKILHRDFDALTAIDPKEHIVLETGGQPLTTRVMDLLTPIGRGQRGLIVAPPRTGKTVLLQHVAAAVAKNHPEMHLIVLLIDERPEEVTEMRRTVKGEVVASSSDRDTISHIRTAELVMERAKRLAEQGRHVFILLDSLTRLARAYNKGSNSGRTMSGGMDIRALDLPKKLFGCARSLEEGGSLTVLGTALIETGSKMDDLIFQEFKGTGNMELVLDRKLSDRRVYPALDIPASGTRKEELLLKPETYQQVCLLRRTLTSINSPVLAMEQFVQKLGKTASNSEFLSKITIPVK